MNTKTLLFLTALLFTFLGCDDGDENNNIDNEVIEPTIYQLTGCVQKGPFISGTVIELYELDANFQQTGKSFTSEIISNNGSFELDNIPLESSNIELKANGYYYNEVSGLLSESQLNLKAIATINQEATININLLSHLVVDRIKQLITLGDNYETAKQTAQSELLDVFKISDISINAFELLSLDNNNNESAILIAISVIIQSNNNAAELTQFLGNLKSDFSDNGTVDNAEMLANLLFNAKSIEAADIRSNLTKKYTELGQSITIPDFEQYIELFIGDDSGDPTTEITFPSNGKHGSNLLAMNDNDEISKGTTYSLAAAFPNDLDLILTLKINSANGNIVPTVDERKQEFWIGSLNNRDEIYAQTKGQIADLPILFNDTGDIEIEMGFHKAGTINEYLSGKSIYLTIK